MTARPGVIRIGVWGFPGVLLVLAVCAAAVLLQAPAPLRALAGTLLVGFLPGLAMLGAVSPTRVWLGVRLVWAFALSLLVSGIVGALDLAVAGHLGEVSVTVCLVALTAAAGAVAAVRSDGTGKRAIRVNVRSSAPYILVFVSWLVLGLATWQAVSMSSPGEFTQLAVAARSGCPGVSILNHEGKAQVYGLVINGSGYRRRLSLHIADGDAAFAALPGGAPSEPLRIDLYRANGSQPYRYVVVPPAPRCKQPVGR